MEKISSLIGPRIGVAATDDDDDDWRRWFLLLVKEENGAVENASDDDAASRAAKAPVDFIMVALGGAGGRRCISKQV